MKLHGGVINETYQRIVVEDVDDNNGVPDRKTIMSIINTSRGAKKTANMKQLLVFPITLRRS